MQMVQAQVRASERRSVPRRIRAAQTDDDKIRAFSPNGERRNDCTVAAAKRLEALKLAVVKRNLKGKILAVEFLAVAGGTEAVRHTAHRGTKYSFLRRVSENTRPIWELDLEILKQ